MIERLIVVNPSALLDRFRPLLDVGQFSEQLFNFGLVSRVGGVIFGLFLDFEFAGDHIEIGYGVAVFDGEFFEYVDLLIGKHSAGLYLRVEGLEEFFIVKGSSSPAGWFLPFYVIECLENLQERRFSCEFNIFLFIEPFLKGGQFFLGGFKFLRCAYLFGYGVEIWYLVGVFSSEFDE